MRRAYSSGTPAIGVGAGNVPVIVDETADLDDAARKICASKIFDNSTSCSSENSVIIVDAVYDAARRGAERRRRISAHRPPRKSAIVATLWRSGKLNRHLIARDADVLAARVRPAGGRAGEGRSSSWSRRRASAATIPSRARSSRWC